MCCHVQAHATATHLAIVTEYADLGTLADYLTAKRQNSGFQAGCPPASPHPAACLP